jgi:hypothetical protein
MELKAGSRWRSAVCDTEVVVVKAPSTPVELACGGHPLLPIDQDRPAGATIDDAFAAGTAIGKRYADDAIGIELLATKGGAGSLSVNGTPLDLKTAKPLPSSD